MSAETHDYRRQRSPLNRDDVVPNSGPRLWAFGLGGAAGLLAVMSAGDVPIIMGALFALLMFGWGWHIDASNTRAAAIRALALHVTVYALCIGVVYAALPVVRWLAG